MVRSSRSVVVVSVVSALFGAAVHRTLTWRPRDDENDIALRLALVATRQNRTIADLEAALTRAQRRREQQRRRDQQDALSSSSSSGSSATRGRRRPQQKETTPLAADDQEQQPGSVRECERKFGRGLVESYRSSRETWCEGGASKVECYRHAYEHDGRVGLFCDATNVVVDFAKVKKAGKYLSFAAGATRADCRRTERWQRRLLMPHASAQLKNLAEGSIDDDDDVRVVEETTYLMARDEDCTNLFHATADHFNAFIVGRVLRESFDWRVVLWDAHPDGPFKELIARAFSRRGPVQRADFRGKVKFRRLIFHLESPAGIIFPKVAGPKGIMPCRASSLWLDFKNFILKAFDLLDVPPPANPSVTLSVRRRTPSHNVGRVFADEQKLIDVLKKKRRDSFTFQVLDLATLPFGEQLRAMRSTNVLVGAHGAGLVHVLFLADEAVLLEIHPSYRLDRHFRLAARMADKVYLPLRSLLPVKCTGSSDAIAVDIAEFSSVLDAALRIARTFHDGVAECGLHCDPRVLALDPGSTPQKGSFPPLSTRFPCS